MDIVKSESYLWHFKRLMALGAPLVVSQVLQFGIGFTDSFMVGQLGEVELSQVGLGSSYLFFLVILPVGISIGISVLMATALAKKNFDDMSEVISAGVWIHAVMVILLSPLVIWNEDILRLLGQPEDTILGAKNYIYLVGGSLLFVYLGNVFRNYLITLERGNAVLWLTLAGFIFNAIGNYIFIFGKFGAPELGLMGSALASVCTNIFVALFTIWLCLRDKMTAEIRPFSAMRRAKFSEIKRLLKIGTPMSFGIISEVGMFQIATIMVGWRGVNALAAHTAVLNTASMSFMIPLGLSIAASVRAGNAIGRVDREGLVKGALVTYGFVVSVMVFSATLFLTIPDLFSGLFIGEETQNRAEVMRLAALMFFGAALFQVFDGVQVVGISVLRGMQDAFVPAVLAFIAYWMIGVPLSYYLGFHLELGGQGVWLGLAAGLAVASVCMAVRLFVRTRPNNFARHIETLEQSA